MRENPMRKNRKFYIGMILNVIEGMLSGFNFFLLYELMKIDRKSTRLNSSHSRASRMPSSA